MIVFRNYFFASYFICCCFFSIVNDIKTNKQHVNGKEWSKIMKYKKKKKKKVTEWPIAMLLLLVGNLRHFHVQEYWNQIGMKQTEKRKPFDRAIYN